MKAFLVGLIFLIAVGIFAGMAIVLYPFIIILGWLLRLAISFALLILAIWLLGKLIILVWEKLR